MSSSVEAKSVIQHVKAVLADTYILYLKTQGSHWNVKGPHFYALHLLFEEQYKRLAEAVDDIAEKIRSSGEEAPASMEEFRALATLQEYRSHMSEEMIIEELAQDHMRIFQKCHEGSRAAQESGDETTADLFIQRCRQHEKEAWMLRSHLNKQS